MCPSGFTGTRCESMHFDPFTIEPHPIEITTPAETTVVPLTETTTPFVPTEGPSA